MFFVLKETLIPLVSLFIFVLGTGFFSTLLSLKLSLHHEPALVIGATTGIFYAGLVLGSFRVERFITRVGHIRAYAAFSATLAVICLLHGIFYHVHIWLFLRFIGGFATAGLFVVIESWLLCKSSKVNRGQVLSLYMITFYASQSLGQFILNLGHPDDLMLFAISSMMCSLSIIPLSMSYVQSPTFDEPSALSLKRLLSKAASGLLGCFSSGLMMGVIYGLLPAYLNHTFHDKASVARYMFAVIFGGMLLQYPVGKISDVIERRLVLILISVAIIVNSILISFSHDSSVYFFILMMLFGGLTFTLYPVSISYACDNLDNKDMVAGTQSLLLTYSVGAMMGPFIAPMFMYAIPAYGLFVYFCAVCGVIIPIFMMRKAKHQAVPQEEPFLPIPQTSLIMAEIDPRGEGD